MQTQKQAAAAAAAAISPASSDAATTSTSAAGASATTVEASSGTTRNQLRPVKFDYADSFACTYVVSVVAAANAELVTYPLDLTKTRLQIQGEGAAAAHHIGSSSGATTAATTKPQVSV